MNTYFLSETLERRQLLSANDFDPSFGVNGVASLGVNQPPEYPWAIAQQMDGKLVTAGHGINPLTDEGQAIIRRWLSNGALDPGFGDDGTVHLPQLYDAGGVEVTSQNKILIAGVSTQGWLGVSIVRLNPDGSLDKSFGGDGIVARFGIEALDSVRGLKVQADGKLVVLVQSEDGGSILRFNADGSADNTFSGDGLERIKINSDFAAFTSITLDTSNRIYATGASSIFIPNGGISSSVVARLTPSGELDPTFDGDGWRFGANYTGASSVLPLADGSLLLCGNVGSPMSTKIDALVQRISDTGVLLDSASINFLGMDNALRAFPTTDGFLIFGSSWRDTNFQGFNYHGMVAKLDPDLNQINSFGDAGLIEVIKGTPLRAVLPLSDGGFAITGDKGIVLKVDASAERDDSFGFNGQTQPPTVGELGSFEKMLALPDGKYLAVGKTLSLAGGWDFYLARFNLNGSYDTSFGGGDGFVTLSYAGSTHTEALKGLALQSDGKIVVVGNISGPDTNGYLVARFTESGSLDNGFDGDGVKMSTSGAASAVAITSSGRIVVAGVTGDQHTFAIQLKSDGSVDASFATNGTFISTENSGAKAMTIQKDGQIIIAGSTLGSGDTDLAAFRLSRTGVLKKTYTTESFFDIRTVVTLSNGTIVFAGANATTAYARFVTQDGAFINDQRFGQSFQGHLAQTVLDAAVDGQNRVTFVGKSVMGDYYKTPAMFVYRTLSNGNADPSFSSDRHDLSFTPTAAVFRKGQPVVAGAANDVLFLARLRGTAFDVSDVRLEEKDLIVVGGEAKNDTIEVKRSGSKIEVKINGVRKSYSLSSVAKIVVIGNGGHDRITLQGALPQPNVLGDAGNDSILGSSSADYIRGGAGFDTIKAGGGNDTVYGDADKDFIEGSSGDDLLSGGDASDNLFGGTGDDTLFGNGGGDQLFGQEGFDRSDPGADDVRNSIELVI